MTGNIDFQGVEFSYPTRDDVQVLKGVDLSIRKGQTVALVGSSGCGKSTTINLLLRFYDKLSGKVGYRGSHVMRVVQFLKAHRQFLSKIINILQHVKRKGL